MAALSFLGVPTVQTCFAQAGLVSPPRSASPARLPATPSSQAAPHGFAAPSSVLSPRSLVSELRQQQGQTALHAAYFKNQLQSYKAKKSMQRRLKEAGSEVKKKKDNVIEMEGTVLMHSRNIFKVALTNGAEISCTLGGKLRMNNIKVLEGDSVTVEMSPFDLTRGRITFRTIDRSLLESDQEKKKRVREEAKEAAKAAKQEEQEEQEGEEGDD